MDYSSGIRHFVSGFALPAIRLVRGGECTGQSGGSFPYQTFNNEKLFIFFLINMGIAFDRMPKRG